MYLTQKLLVMFRHKNLTFYKTNCCMKIYPAWTQQSFKTIAKKALEGIKWFPQISKDQIILELFCFTSNFDILNQLLNVDSSCNNCKICSVCPFVCTRHSGIQQTSCQDMQISLYKIICTLSVPM